MLSVITQLPVDMCGSAAADCVFCAFDHRWDCSRDGECPLSALSRVLVPVDCRRRHSHQYALILFILEQFEQQHTDSCFIHVSVRWFIYAEHFFKENYLFLRIVWNQYFQPGCRCFICWKQTSLSCFTGGTTSFILYQRSEKSNICSLLFTT